MATFKPSREEITKLIMQAVTTILKRRGAKADLTEQTILSGSTDAVLDSLGMVMLTVEIEQLVEDSFNGTLRLAPEGLLSATTGDLETIGTMADLVLASLEPLS